MRTGVLKVLSMSVKRVLEQSEGTRVGAGDTKVISRSVIGYWTSQRVPGRIGVPQGNLKVCQKGTGVVRGYQVG